MLYLLQLFVCKMDTLILRVVVGMILSSYYVPYPCHTMIWLHEKDEVYCIISPPFFEVILPSLDGCSLFAFTLVHCTSTLVAGMSLQYCTVRGTCYSFRCFVPCPSGKEWKRRDTLL